MINLIKLFILAGIVVQFIVVRITILCLNQRRIQVNK